MLGFLNLNKPSQVTSHDCVAMVRRILKTKQVGHGGTLDPAAMGVLPIAVGKATRLLSFLPENKAYQAKIRLGITTTTDDLEGEIIESIPSAEINLATIEAILPQFMGLIQQIPPAYSAIQIQGKRLYDLARKGEKVDVPVRNVRVDHIEILAWYPGEFPEIELAIACGPGTYIRAIARDLGNLIGVGGTLASLIRTESCGFELSNSLIFEQISHNVLIPPIQALQHLPIANLSDTEARRWCQGQKVSTDKLINYDQQFLQVHHEDGTFLGIGELIISDSLALLGTKVNIFGN